MNILHVCKTDMGGGAARAAYRINEALNTNSSLNSKMRVIIKKSNEKNILSKNDIFNSYLFPKYLAIINKIYRLGFKTKNNIIHSTALIKTGLERELRFYKLYNDVDIIHLHWLGDITLSIEEIGLIRKPIVWTLHDQWPFCGAEHYTYPNPNNKSKFIDKRYFSNYEKESRLSFESGRDINRLTWLRKKKAWGKKMHIVCPSKWMNECAKKSSLFKNHQIITIPNPIDTNFWLPIPQEKARKELNLPLDKRLILFGAMSAGDKRKGIHFLLEALNKLNLLLEEKMLKQIELIIFGEENNNSIEINYPIRFSGRINNDKKLNLIYSAADIFVNPSMQESFGQTASEAHACGTPVVAFDFGGLKDIVEHLETGYLAEPYDTTSLAIGIKWTIENYQRNQIIGIKGREKAVKKWDYGVISEMYSEIYKNILS